MHLQRTNNQMRSRPIPSHKHTLVLQLIHQSLSNFLWDTQRKKVTVTGRVQRMERRAILVRGLPSRCSSTSEDKHPHQRPVSMALPGR